MDVANSLHMPENEDDETFRAGVEFMRRRAASQIEGEEWTLVDSWERAIPRNVGTDAIKENEA